MKDRLLKVMKDIAEDTITPEKGVELLRELKKENPDELKSVMMSDANYELVDSVVEKCGDLIL
jgi:hypothetical protein